MASWKAHRPEAKSQGRGPRTGQVLNIHKKENRKTKVHGFREMENERKRQVGCCFFAPLEFDLIKVNLRLLKR